MGNIELVEHFFYPLAHGGLGDVVVFDGESQFCFHGIGDKLGLGVLEDKTHEGAHLSRRGEDGILPLHLDGSPDSTTVKVGHQSIDAA